MDIKTEEKDGVAVLRIKGRMDLAEIAFLDERVKTLRAQGLNRFVLNLVDVTEITSSGIGRILNIHRTLEGVEGGGLALADLSPVVEYVLDLARLADVFPTFPQEDAAVAYLNGE